MVTEPVTIAGLQIDANGGNPKVKILATDFTLNGYGYLAERQSSKSTMVPCSEPIQVPPSRSIPSS